MDKQEIANFIKRLRIEKFGEKFGAQKKFADFLGIKYTTYRENERGKIGVEVLKSLREKMGVDINYLLSGEGKSVQVIPSDESQPQYIKAAATTLGERLRFLREERLSIPREKFVEGLNITPKDLERFENDETSPDMNFVYSLWMKFNDRITLADIDWLVTGEQKEAAEEGTDYKAVPVTTPEEQEYLEKLLQVLRNPATKKAIQENLDTFLKVPRPEFPLEEKEKKGGMAS